jgi:hypothetical protein
VTVDPHDDIRRALGAEVAPEELDALLSLAEALERERPLPTPAFRGALRRRLVADAKATPTAPRRLRALVTACAGSGATLLAIAAIGVAGAGPFAA